MFGGAAGATEESRYGGAGTSLRGLDPLGLNDSALNLHDTTAIPHQPSTQSLLYNQNYMPTDRPQTSSGADFRGAAVPQTSSLAHGHNQSMNLLPGRRGPSRDGMGSMPGSATNAKA